MILAVEALRVIHEELARLRQDERSELASGKRAALWRAQQEAARRGRSLRDLRRYCLDSLQRPRQLRREHENDYLRGYREGLQLVLNEIRRLETARTR